MTAQQPQITANIAITSLPSPLPSTDSPMSNVQQQQQQTMLGQAGPTGVPSSVGQPVFRPNQNQPGMQQMPPHSQSMVPPINIGRPGGHMGNPQFPNQPLAAPPGYHPTQIGTGRPPPRWAMMPPQQRPPYMPSQQQQNTQGSALIAQLTQPPSSMPPTQQVNQFGQMTTNANPQLNPQQAIRISMMNNQQQMNIQQQNVQQNTMNQNQMQQSQLAQNQMNPNQMTQNQMNQNQMNQTQLSQNQMNQNQMSQNQLNQTQLNQNQLAQNQLSQAQNPTSIQQPTSSAIGTQSMTVSPPIGVVSTTPIVSQAQQNTVQQSRERHTIWHGVLEWIEKAKNPTDQQKLTRHVPCSVSANPKDGEPELCVNV